MFKGLVNRIESGLCQNQTEKGGQSVSSGSKVANHNETPTHKKICLARAPLGTSGPPPLREKGGESKFPRNSLKKKGESNLARRKRSQ